MAADHGGQYSKSELLYFKGCPGSLRILDILRRIVAEEGLAARVVPVASDHDDRSDFPGSPTILVDGEDHFPTDRHVRAASCRIYPTPEGPRNHPTAAMVREALAERMP